MSRLSAFVQSPLAAFTESPLVARGGGVGQFQYYIFYSASTTMKMGSILISLPTYYESVGTDYIGYYFNRYNDLVCCLSSDIFLQESWFTTGTPLHGYIPANPVSDTDPIRVRIWAYQKPGTGAPTVTKLTWGTIPTAQQLLGLSPFQGRIEINGYAIDVTPMTVPTITLAQYLLAYQYGQNIQDNNFLPFGGINYTTANVSFSYGNAAATAVISNGAVVVINITNAGSGYGIAPLITITGDGSGANAIAYVTNGSITRIQVQGNIQSDIKPWICDTKQYPIIGFGSGQILSITVTNGGSGYTSAPSVTITGDGSGATATAGLSGGSVNVITVNNPGDGYSTANVIIGGGTGATAAVQMTYVIGSVQVTNGGSGYTTAPSISFTGGGGSGALAHSTLGSSVTGITLIDGGSGYVNVPSVMLSGNATATATLTDGVVTSITITNPGSGYSTPPTVTFTPFPSGAPGSGASATATLGQIVTSIVLDNPGSGYTSIPTVNIDTPPLGGIQATATASFGSGTINGIMVVFGGSGYDTAPTVTFLGGGGSGLTGHAVVSDGVVTCVIIDAYGTGYSSPPLVVFSGIVVATAIANIDSQYQSFGTCGYKLANTKSQISIQPDHFDNTYDNAYIRGYGFEGTLFGDAINADNYQDPYYIAGQQLASATANLANGPTLYYASNGTAVPNYYLASLTIVNAGVGYGKIPLVTINCTANTFLGQNFPYQFPSATAIINGGNITGFNITPGFGFYQINSVTITVPSWQTALATCTINASVSSVVITSGGKNYINPTVLIAGTATGTATVVGGVITGITITNGGANYTTAPTITVTDTMGTGFTAYTIINGPVVSITLTQPGYGYVTPPTVTFLSGGGDGAAASCTIDTNNTGAVLTLNLTNGGSGYMAAPLVKFTIETPFEDQKPINENVNFFALLVPGTYDYNNVFIPSQSNPSQQLPCFWLGANIQGNTYYTYQSWTEGLGSSEQISMYCGGAAVDRLGQRVFIIPPVGYIGATDAFGSPVASTDYWWIAGPDSVLGGNAGFGPYTVGPDAQPFYVYNGSSPCASGGGVPILSGAGPLSWFIFWNYSITYNGPLIYNDGLGNNPLFISTHNPTVLKTMPYKSYLPSYAISVQFTNLEQWYLQSSTDVSAAFNYPSAQVPDVCASGLDPNASEYFFPFSYGSHIYTYASMFFANVNSGLRYGSTGGSNFGSLYYNDNYIGQNILYDYITNTGTFAPLVTEITALVVADMSLLCNGLISGGEPNFGGIYNSADVQFGITLQADAATAVAVISGGIVTAVNLTFAGLYYNFSSSAPTVTIAPPSGFNGIQATAIAIGWGSGSGGQNGLTSIQVTNGGSGYTSVPTVTIGPAPSIIQSSFGFTGPQSFP